MKIRIRCFLILLLLLPLMALAQSKAKTQPNPGNNKAQNQSGKTQEALDKSEVMSLYMSGEFETLVSLLESIRRERQLRDREDSIFIYKFLGVIYGANDNTKRKAESFLFQMLKLAPEEDLLTLGVGDSVEAIFNRVRERYAKLHGEKENAAGLQSDQLGFSGSGSEGANTGNVGEVKSGGSGKSASGRQTDSGNGASRKWIWIASGGAAAAAVTGIVLVALPPEKKTQTIEDSFK